MILFAGIPVVELAAAREWYERLTGRPPDMVPNDSEFTWQLGEEAWLYVVRDVDRAGRALVTVLVDDLDAHAAELASRGISTGELETIPGAVRKLKLTDPEGNRITFGQPLRS